MNLKFLVDIIPAAARKYVYAVVALGLYVWGVWQATDGNWLAFVIALATALASTLATANTNVKPAAVESGGEGDLE